MEVHQARAFVTVAEELHFGRAAERLGMAQPPLSRTIRALETKLGIPLFARTTRSVSLTSAGSALVEPARRLLESERAVMDVAERAVSGHAGLVRFGFSSTSSKSLAAELVTAVRRRYPAVDFELRTSVYAQEGVADLLGGDLDLALVRWNRRPAGIVGRPVLVEHPAVALPRSHRLAGQEIVSIKELAGEEFIMLPERPSSSLRETALRLCTQAGFTPRVVQTAPDSQTITALVAAGMGVAITSDSVAMGSRDSGMVTVPIDDPRETTLVYLAHARDRVNPSLDAVLAVADSVLPTWQATGSDSAAR